MLVYSWCTGAVWSMQRNLSSYAENLSNEAKTRYREKIGVIGGLDPFGGCPGEPCEEFPPVEASDLVAYLVLQTNFITAKQFKAYKSLEAYNQFVCGWVKDVYSWKIAGQFVTTGRVRHSQRFSETPLHCWIIFEETGEVCCAHCNCMAGLGETCTHIAAVLFYLEAAARIQGKQTCTQRKCEWILPSFLKNVEYLPVKNIDFTSARKRKRNIDAVIDTGDTVQLNRLSSPNTHERQSTTTTPSDSDLEDFYDKLSSTGTKPAILSLISKYSSAYIPKRLLPTFPQPLPLLYRSEYLDMEYHLLLKACESIEINIADEMAVAIESETRNQSNSKLWFRYRAGRVTASRMKAVCHTDATNPSQSLVKSICYPESFCFTSQQTTWGCKHEKSAQDLYLKTQKPKHTNLAVQVSGLVINPLWPFIGASPDGLLSCTCCGGGTLEIKCPFCHRGEDVAVAASKDRKFCLQPSSDGSLRLDRSHAYYYQVQTQLFVSDVEYCDFCVCTFSGDETGVHIERISKDIDLWNDCVIKAQTFFKTCILPELLGKWYTRPSRAVQRDPQGSSVATAETSDSDSNGHQLVDNKYCYCGGPEEGTMIACENEDCAIEWFHTDCLMIDTIPRGKWYCPDCRKLPKFNRKRACAGTK